VPSMSPTTTTLAEDQAHTLNDILKKVLLCTVYISVSTVLIRFNKAMMQPDYFPFAMALSFCHMLVATFMCAALCFLAPSMFPAMEATRGERTALLKWIVPIALCFGVMLFGSNEAYVYCSVTMLQFMKEANVMIVFLLSCAVGFQPINRIRVVLLMWVVASASVSVTGDIRFSLVGVCFQALSQVAECLRVVMGEHLLSGRKLDPLTYTAFVAPVSAAFLGIATACTWDPQAWVAMQRVWPLVGLNSLVAFALNVLVATVIKEISAVGFVLTGLLKDIVIVVLSRIIFADPVTVIQWAGFAATVLGVGLWSLLKINPQALPVQMLEKALCTPKKTGEEAHLL